MPSMTEAAAMTGPMTTPMILADGYLDVTRMTNG